MRGPSYGGPASVDGVVCRISGTVTLTSSGDKTKASMTLRGSGVKGNHSYPTHIQTGTRDHVGSDPTGQPNTVIRDSVANERASARTVGNLSLNELVTGDRVILVHKSKEVLTAYFVAKLLLPSDEAPEDTGPRTGTD